MTNIDYLDLELAIRSFAAGDYLVTVLRSPQGEAQAQITWPWSPATFDQLLRSIQEELLAADPVHQSVGRSFGELLFQTLLGGEIGVCYAASRAAAASQGKGLRLKLRIEAAELMAVPWELLYDPRAGEFVALSRQTPLVRYLAVAQPIQPMAIKPPLRILGVAASPAGLAPLDLAQEQRQLAAALAPLVAQGQTELVWLAGQGWRDLQMALHNGPWHILHFVGHAFYDQTNQEGVILLAAEDGAPWPLGAGQFSRLVADLPELRLVVLNACEGARGEEQQAFSSLAAALVRRGLPAVIAMQYALSDRAALEFARSFYTGLAAGLPIDAATGEARKALSLSDRQSLAWMAPALLLRAPDGQLWSRAEVAVSSVVPPSSMPRPEPQVNANIQIGGAAIGSTIVVGTNAQAVGGGAAAGQPHAADDLRWFEQQSGQLLFAVRTLRGQLDKMTLAMAELQLQVLQGELTKSAAGQTPAAATIITSVEWLLENAPDLAPALLRFLRGPASRRALDQAGNEGVQWASRKLRG